MFRHLRFFRTARQRVGHFVDSGTRHRGRDLGQRRLACEPLESRRLLSVSLGGDGEGLPDVPPVVTDVIVRGSDWNDAFLDFLDADGLGHPTVARQGYRIPDGAGQLDPLPWANIDTISVAFSEDVRVEPGDLGLYGVATADYLAEAGLTPESFEYDSVQWVATWKLPEPIGVDRLKIRLDGQVGGVSDGAGNLLDGEWEDGGGEDSSGDGMMGGDFVFGVNVLPGDGNQDGIVHLADAMAVRAKNLSSPGDGNYAPSFDLDGNAVVDATDATIVRAGLLDRLSACVAERIASTAFTASSFLPLALGPTGLDSSTGISDASGASGSGSGSGVAWEPWSRLMALTEQARSLCSSSTDAAADCSTARYSKT